MSDTRVVTIPNEKSASLGMLRHLEQIDVAAEQDRIWVRVRRLDEGVEQALHKLPDAEHYAVSSDGRLFPVGQLAPIGRLPDLAWTANGSFIRPALPQAALAGRHPSACRLALRRASTMQAPNVLVTDLRALAGYGCAAPEVRLNRWRFAVNADGRALIWGEPLPPLPGQMYVERDRVAVPLGWQVVPARLFSRDPKGSALPAQRERAPALDSSVLAQVLNIGPGELVLFRHDASIERIPADGFERATRSALRASLEGAVDD
jgi:MoxR-vWA-beta-propeller ternary system domain bpX2